MGRRPRLDFPGAIHHVYLHALDELLLFVDDVDRAAFLALLRQVVRRFGLRCLAWALMDNHVHLVIETGDMPVSAAVHRLARGYADHYNARHGRKGHVFRSRFGSRLVDGDAYLYKVIAYVLGNPLGAPGAGSADALSRYPWTACAEIFGAPTDAVVDIAGVLALFGNTPEEGRLGLLAALAEECGEDEKPLRDGAIELTPRAAIDERLRGMVGVDGRQAFLARAAHAWEARSARRRWLLARGWSLTALVAVVCDAIGTTPAALRSGRRARPEADARAVIAHVACDLAGESGARVARAVGTAPPAIPRCRRRGLGVLAVRGLSAEFLLGASCARGERGAGGEARIV